ncbi:MAG: hypothetical protein AAGK32_19020, partial [Actinomycetota bacterium]
MATDQETGTGPPLDTEGRPASLEEALGAPADDDIRAVWDDLAADTGPAPLEDRLLVAPLAPPRITPSEPVGPDVLDDDPVQPDDDPQAESWRERRRRRRREKDERRSERLELRRHRILPRTVIGISMLLLAAAVG